MKLIVGAIALEDLPLGVRVHVEMLSQAIQDLDTLQDQLDGLTATSATITEVMGRMAKIGSAIAQSAGTIARAVEA